MEGLGVQKEVGGQAAYAKKGFQDGVDRQACTNTNSQGIMPPNAATSKACGQPVMPTSATAPTCPPATAGCQLHAPHAAASLEVGPHPSLAHHGALHTKKAS